MASRHLIKSSPIKNAKLVAVMHILNPFLTSKTSLFFIFTQTHVPTRSVILHFATRILYSPNGAKNSIQSGLRIFFPALISGTKRRRSGTINLFHVGICVLLVVPQFLPLTEIQCTIRFMNNAHHLINSYGIPP